MFAFVSPVLVYIDTTIMQVSMQSIQDKMPFSHVVKTLLFYLIIAIVIYFISEWHARYSAKEKVKIQNKMNSYIYLKAKKTDMHYLDTPEFYDVYSWAVQGYYKNSMSAVTLLSRIVAVLLNIFVILSLIISTSPIIVVFSITNVVTTVVLNALSNKVNYQKRLDSIKIDRRDSYTNRAFYLSDFAQDMRVTGLCQRLLHRYDKNTDDRIKIIKKYQNKNSSISFATKLINITIFIATIIYLTYQATYNNLSYGSFALLISASQNLISQLTELTSFLPSLIEHGLNAEKIIEFCSLNSVIETNYTETIIEPKACVIELRDVCFNYPENKNFVLKNINLKIKNGEKVAIVGKNGAGKTTLTKLLLRLYDPTSGNVLVNGIDIKKINIIDLRKKLGYVPQKNNLFAMTLRENLELNCSTQNPDAYIDIFNVLELSKYLGNLDSETTREFVSDGLIFSGGETQKLGIIRAALSKYSCVILDEPTASLDPVSESKLIDFISNRFQDVTTIMIAHRLSTIRHFDKICVFDNGEIVEIGTHDTLMKEKGIYYEMFTSQSENYLP